MEEQVGGGTEEKVIIERRYEVIKRVILKPISAQTQVLKKPFGGAVCFSRPILMPLVVTDSTSASRT